MSEQLMCGCGHVGPCLYPNGVANNDGCREFRVRPTGPDDRSDGQ